MKNQKQIIISRVCCVENSI